MRLPKLGKRGQGVVDAVVGVIIAAMIITIGVIITAEFFGANLVTATDHGADAEDAYNTTQDMNWTSFGILPITILVLAAVAVIGAVMILRGR